MPKINTAYTFDVALVSQADTRLFQVNPTLAAGDVKVSIDEGAFSNTASLPTVTPAGGRTVKVALTAGEMNGNRISVQFADAAGAEWCELLYEIETSPDDLSITNIVNANWNEVTSSHTSVGTFGEAGGLLPLTAATTRAAVGLASANLDSQISGVSSAVAAVPTATQNADALLKRDMSAVTGESTRSPINALRFNRNKFKVVGNTLTVYKEDDVTIAWTAVLEGINAFDIDPS